MVKVILFNAVISYYNLESGFDDFGMGKVEKLFVFVFFGPILETLLANTLLQFILFKYIKNSIVVIVLASILFGLSHNYSIVYILFAFISGLIYNTFYFTVASEYNTTQATLFTFYLHAINNFTGFVVLELL